MDWDTLSITFVLFNSQLVATTIGCTTPAKVSPQATAATHGELYMYCVHRHRVLYMTLYMYVYMYSMHQHHCEIKSDV